MPFSLLQRLLLSLFLFFLLPATSALANPFTVNMSGDASGINPDDELSNLQNFPEVESASYDGTADEVTVTYRAPTGPTNATYPLAVDFHQADSNTSEFSGQAQPLPVELVSFEAKQTKRGVTLTWQTTSEQHNSGFAVERKESEAEAWAELGFVEGAGATSQAQHYHFTDEELSYEAVTYRLKQVDTDGTAHYSKAVEIEVATPRTFVLHGNFPNPARGTTTIRYELPKAETVRLVVYDLLGREVTVLVDERQEAGRKKLAFDISRLASGAYLYRIEAGSHTATRRLIVMQ